MFIQGTNCGDSLKEETPTSMCPLAFIAAAPPPALQNILAAYSFFHISSFAHLPHFFQSRKWQEPRDVGVVQFSVKGDCKLESAFERDTLNRSQGTLKVSVLQPWG